jgi:FAD/FMN-containing dehydrogenase
LTAPPLPAALRARLAAALPADALSDDPDDLAEYGRDWTKVYAPAPSVIAFPRSTAEVATILSLCDAAGVAVVPSGGRTGLAGGAVARHGELVLSLSRMRAMAPVDALAQTVHVEAGAVTEAVHHHCAPHGLTWPVDFASKGSSQVGGNIATNAGGVKVIRYGLTRQWVLGLVVVTARGDILRLNGALEKNNTGLDLRQVFIGTEGTLGVITEATLKLTRLPPPQTVLLLGVSDLQAVLTLFAEARRGPFTLSAFEFFTDACLARLQRHRKVRPPFDTPCTHYVLMEVEPTDADALSAWAAKLFEDGLALDGTMSQDGSQAAALWALREGISESLSATGLPHKNDIALPLAALQTFCGELNALLAERYPAWELCLFGHIGDGNLHVNVMKPDAMDKADFLAQTHEADAHMFDLVRRHGGSVSAEHGIGLLKKPWLGHTRAPEELSLLKAFKRALDPNNTLNPGKIFDV